MPRERLPTGVVTFLLTDVEGSTALWDRRPDVMGRALRLHDALIDTAVTDAGGRVLKARGEGDSTFAVFERPTGAIRAALAARRALQSAEWPEGCRLEVRFAVHSGEVEERDGDYYGNAVNRAARMRGLAVGGQVLVSQAVAEMVADNLPPDALFVEVGQHELHGLSRPERISALVDASRPIPEAIGGFCPYKGLLAFQPEDDGVFFGREATVALLLDRLLERRLVVVVGASGSGKSSVVRAGVLAAVRRGDIPGSADWSTLIMTPGDHPCARLDEFDATADARTVIAVDQMEEMFTACNDPAERAEFVARLIDASTRESGRTLVIGAMRADFFGHSASVPGFAAALSDATVLLGPMDEGDVRRAIEAPAAIAGLRLEPGLVDVMLRDLGREPGSLPLLSHALLETWRRRAGTAMTLTGYQESGGVRGAIAHTAEGVWNQGLSEADRPVARRIFLRLTELGEGTEDTRRRVHRAELVTGDDATETDRVLGVLVDRRLVTVDDNTVEVAHEALIREWPRLRGWLDDDREGLRIHRHLTHVAYDWDALGRADSELYRGPRLAATRDWLARDEQAQLNVLEAGFVEASEERERAEAAEEVERVAARERANRRLRLLLVATATALVVALVAGVVAFTQRSRANRNAEHAHTATVSAEIDRAVADVPNLVDRDRSLAALLAVQAFRLRPDAATRGALMEVVRADPRLRFTLTGGHTGYAWSRPYPDGHRVVAFGREGGDVWDLEKGTKVGSFEVSTEGHGLSISPDGKRLATGDAHGAITIWDANTLKPVGAPVQVGAPVTDLAFGPDGASVAVAVGRLHDEHPVTENATPRVWDIATGRPRATLGGHSSSVFAVVLSHDGTMFATGGNDNLVVLHDAATGRQLGAPINVGTDVYTLAFSDRDDRLIAGLASSGGPPQGAVVIDVATHTASGPVSSGTLAIAAFANGDRDLFVAGDDAELLDSRTFIRHGDLIQTQHGPATVVSLAGIGLVLTGFDGTVSVWQPDANALLAQTVADAGRGGGAYSPDGQRIVLTNNDGTARLYSSPDLRLVTQLATTASLRTALPPPAAFSADSSVLALADITGNVQLFDGRTGTPRGPPIQTNRGVIFGIAFSPDGKTIVTTSLFDPESGAQTIDVASGRVAGFDPPVPFALSATFRPDGRRVAVTSGAGNGGIYEFADGKATNPDALPGGTAIEVAAYSPDGRLLAGGGQDGRIRFFDAETLRETGSPLSLSSRLISSITFSHDGRLMAVQDLHGGNQLADAVERARIGPPFVGSDRAPQADFGSAAFSPDSDSLVLPTPDETEIWDIVPKHAIGPACAIAGRSLTREEWHKYFANAGAYRQTCPETRGLGR